MHRSFQDWWSSLPSDIKEKIQTRDTSLNVVDYVWISNIISNELDADNPNPEELLYWIKTNQINAIRK